ncbi:hypothetical protein [Streptomyces sp. NPDC050528]|uniref:hypothetical protein n=1 Tax=unclassified Streptomyces TaxID=2593676 RepID=UPI00378CD28B
MLDHLRLADRRTTRDPGSMTGGTDTGRPLDATPTTSHRRIPAMTTTGTETV